MDTQLELRPIQKGWIVADTDIPPTDEAVLAALWARGVRVLVIGVGHSAGLEHFNLTPANAERILKYGFGVMVYLVPTRKEEWTVATGALDAMKLAAAVVAAELPQKTPALLDLEGPDMGPDVVGFAKSGVATLRAAVLRAGIYNENTSKLTGEQLGAIGADLYWAAAEAVPKPNGLPYAMAQRYANQTIAGAVFDLGEVLVDGELAVFAVGAAAEPTTVPKIPASASASAPVASAPALPAPPAAWTPTGAPQLGPPYPTPPAGLAWKLVAEATDDEIAEHIARIARPWAGLSDAPTTRAAFREVVGPLWLEGPSMSSAMAGSWCCAETGEGLVRALFMVAIMAVRLKLHAFKLYVVEMAMGFAIEDAEALGCKKTHADGLPRKGSSVIIDGGEHDISCVTGTPVEGQPCDAVEGGNQVVKDGKPYMAIAAGRRVFHASGAIASADGKTLHAEYVWLDWVLGMRNAAKIDPGLQVLVPAPPPPTPPLPAPEPAPPAIVASPITTSPARPNVPVHSLQALLAVLAPAAAVVQHHFLYVACGAVFVAIVLLLALAWRRQRAARRPA